MTIRQRLTTAALLGLFGLAATLPGASAVADDVQWDKTVYDVQTGATVDLTEGGGSPLDEAIELGERLLSRDDLGDQRSDVEALLESARRRKAAP